MSINLALKFSPKLDERYKHNSFTDAWCGTNYDWEGVNAIKVYTINTGKLNDYDATKTANRFGTPHEVEDEVNTYQLLRKRSFSETIDVTNTQDQLFIKKSSAYLKQMWDYGYVPEIDRYRLKTWAEGAGLGTLNTTALTKTTVVKAMLTGLTALDDAGVPFDGRVLYVRSDTAIDFRLADEFKADGLGQRVIKRQIGDVNGTPVVAVPPSFMPKGVVFMIKHKQSTADPTKLKTLRAHNDPPGIAGVLLEGLVRYDSFVLAQKADGIYVYASDADAVCAAPTFSIASNKVTIESTTSGSTIKYTTDGTNPKTSTTAQVYSAAVTITADTEFRAYASKSGLLSSPITAYDAVKS